MMNLLPDQPYMEIQITIRNKDTGVAREYTYFRSKDVSFGWDTGSEDLGRHEDRVKLEFIATTDEDHEDKSLLIKDLDKVPPCTCYEQIFGKKEN